MEGKYANDHKPRDRFEPQKQHRNYKDNDRNDTKPYRGYAHADRQAWNPRFGSGEHSNRRTARDNKRGDGKQSWESKHESTDRPVSTNFGRESERPHDPRARNDRFSSGAPKNFGNRPPMEYQNGSTKRSQSNRSKRANGMKPTRTSHSLKKFALHMVGTETLSQAEQGANTQTTEDQTGGQHNGLRSIQDVTKAMGLETSSVALRGSTFRTRPGSQTQVNRNAQSRRRTCLVPKRRLTQ